MTTICTAAAVLAQSTTMMEKDKMKHDRDGKMMGDTLKVKSVKMLAETGR